MSVQPFGSGGVLSRAQPVLTFAASLRALTTETLPAPSEARVRSEATGPREGTRSSELPIVARIVRRTTAMERAQLFAPRAFFLGPAFLVWVRALLRRSGLGPLIVGLLALATLGAIAGLGVRSLSDDGTTSVPPSRVERSIDSNEIERLLTRPQPPPSVDDLVSSPMDRSVTDHGSETVSSPVAPSFSSGARAVGPPPASGVRGTPRTVPRPAPTHPMQPARTPGNRSARSLENAPNRDRWAHGSAGGNGRKH
jgi:hypothetical protein